MQIGGIPSFERFERFFESSAQNELRELFLESDAIFEILVLFQERTTTTVGIDTVDDVLDDPGLDLEQGILVVLTVLQVIIEDANALVEDRHIGDLLEIQQETLLMDVVIEVQRDLDQDRKTETDREGQVEALDLV